MFAGREIELKALQEVFRSDGCSCVLVHGPRGVGKTTLVSHACEGFRTIFHMATKTTGKKTLAELSMSALGDSGPGFAHFEQFLAYVGDAAADETLVLVLDEFPLLALSVPHAIQALQRFIGTRFLKTRLKLVLCGTSVALMEQQLLGSHGPCTKDMEIFPFKLSETRMLFGGTLEKSVLIHLVTGGIPRYVSCFSLDESMDETIRRVCFRSDGLLYHEPLLRLCMEVAEPQAFFAVMELLARGIGRQSELAAQTGLSSPNISYYLAKLHHLEIVDKELPFGETNRKRTLWYITDSFLLFYFTCVYPHRSSIERGLVEDITKDLKQKISSYAERQFVQLCKHHLLSQEDMSIVEMGSWWDSGPQSARNEKIDIVARTVDGDMLFGTCKYSDEAVWIKELEDLIRISKRVASNRKRSYWIFSKSGFTSGVTAIAKNHTQVRLVTLEELCD